MPLESSSTAVILSNRGPSSPQFEFSLTTGAASVPGSDSVDRLCRFLDRQDSGLYGKKEHKEVNKSFQEVLTTYIQLLQILRKQQEDESYIDEAAIDVAHAKRAQVQQLLKVFEKQASGSKWYSRFRTTDRNKGFYGVDLELFRLLDNGLEALIENFQSARKKKLSMRQDIDRLVQTQDLSALQLRQAPIALKEIPPPINPNEVLLAKKAFRQLKVNFLPYWKRHDQYSRERLPNTCEWIRKTEAYQRWTGMSDKWRDQRQLLWLHGAAGAGKSILASYVVDTRRNRGKSVAYSYFGNGLVQTVPEVAVSLLTQLWIAVESDNNAAKILSDNTAVEKFDHWTYSCFQKFSHEFTPKPSIVLDGWDEERMDDPPRFRRFLSMLLDLDYYVLLTSKSKPDSSVLGEQTHNLYNISLPDREQRADLVAFSEHVLMSHQNAPAYTVVNEVKDKIFKWIIDDQHIFSFHTLRLYLESALRQTSEAEVQSILKETNLGRLDFQDRAGYPARQISAASLLWLSQTKKPMKIDALREALALLETTSAQHEELKLQASNNHPSKIPNTFPEADQLPTIAFVRSCGMNLLHFDEASDTVTLSRNFATLRSPSPHTQTISGLADMCISVLSIVELDTFDYKNLNVVRDYTSNHQFLCHAASTFQLHIENGELSEDMRPTFVQILGDRSRLWKVIAIQEWCKQDFDDITVSDWQNRVQKVEQTTAVQVVIECGDWKTLRELLDLSQQQSESGVQDRKPALTHTELESWCFLAYNHDRRSICFDMLYETFLDLTLQEELPQASTSANLDCNLSLVSSHQSDTSSETWQKVHRWFDKRHNITGYETDFTKLSSQVQSRDILALRSAWSRASDPKLRGAIVSCALQAVVLNKDTEMLGKLLRCGLVPSQRLTAAERRHYSPLHAAAQIGSLRMLKILLDYGADVNVANAAGETALFSAIEFAYDHHSSPSSISLIQTLLTSGIEVDTPRKNKQVPTALDLAIAKDLVAVVELLLRHGARHILAQQSTDPSPRSTNLSSALSGTTSNDSYSSYGEEIRSMLEKRQRALVRLQRSRAKRMSQS